MTEAIIIEARRAYFAENEFDYAVCIIGSPRSGKSSMLNQLGGRFDAGWCMQAGLTQDTECGISQIGNKRILLINLPGMGEPTKLKRHVKALKRGLVQSNRIRLIFVIRIDFGLFNLADVILMKTTLKSCKLAISCIGVIFNHCCAEDMATNLRMEAHIEKLKQDTGYAGSMKCTFIRRNSIASLPRGAGEKLRSLVNQIDPARVVLFPRITAFWRKIFDRFKTAKARQARYIEDRIISNEELFTMPPSDDNHDVGDDPEESDDNHDVGDDLEESNDSHDVGGDLEESDDYYDASDDLEA
ncbi:hypothetical protein BGX21_000166 [Mortierella sp. AD011]|nr:hypothetical protein BGX21_000166 [Mortierella sp. AD011]